ncbi:MAG: aminoacyl-tRNA hydrolase, partial [Coprobacillus sp.]|nr:aminoacyl-tRNA hydrolase [Coprobacillus sp.]
MKLIVGLGNPGKKYDKTRHNMGYLVIDEISDKLNIDIDKEAFHGEVGRGSYLDESVILFKPTTFMNLSGTAVKEISDYFKIDIKDILIIYDDMAL